MADNVAITAGSGTTVAADEVAHGTLGTVKVQYVKLMDGTIDGTTEAVVGANGLAADVKAVVPGTGASNLGKAEDAAHTSGDVGVMPLAVRKDTAAALADTDGDYSPLSVDATGHLYVKLSSTQLESTVSAQAAMSAGGHVKTIPPSDAVHLVKHNTTGIGHGVKTVTTAGTDEALAGSTTANWVVIQAQTDNTGWIAVGATGVDATVATGTGILLAPGDSIHLTCDNLADIFIDSTVNGEGVRYTYGT